jgi:CheY-like chemotaxis protein
MANRLMVIPGDSADLRALPSQMSGEFEVQLLENANDALWEVRMIAPDVIVANVDLAGMSGLDLAEILPNFGVVTRVVLWSQRANPQATQQATELGVYRFLTAPIAIGDLCRIVADALRDAQAAAVAAAEVEAAKAAEEVAAEEPPPPPPVQPERSKRMHDVPAPPPERERTRRMHDVAPAPVAPERTRRMHDVAPAPPERERTRRPHDVSPAPTLAERARRAAQETPAPPPPPEPSTKPSHTRQGALVLTADNLKPIRSRMEALEREVGSQCIMLADRAGMLLAEAGITTGLPTMILLPLLSTSFSTAGQISQMLREKESSALYVHEGVNYDVYCFDILQRYMLVIVFSKSGGSQATKIGSVWVYAKRAIRDMEDLLS